jgi:hypothetical protein
VIRSLAAAVVLSALGALSGCTFEVKMPTPAGRFEVVHLEGSQADTNFLLDTVTGSIYYSKGGPWSLYRQGP